MSNNRDLINILRNIKYNSVSKIDMKYNKIFKEYSIDNLIEHNNFAKSVRKKWSNDYDNSKYTKKTTNDKLKHIISTNKNASKIKDIFFKTFDKESLIKKMIKKNKKSRNKLSLNELSSKIQKIIDNRKKFNVSNAFLKKRLEENTRSPPICLYSPKYNYIYKHMPGFNFNNEKTISRKIFMDNKGKFNNSKEVKKNFSLKELNLKNINSNSYKNIKNSFNSPPHSLNKRGQISFINDSNNENKENNENQNDISDNNQQKNFFLSQQNSPINRLTENKVKVDYYCPKLVEKNVLVPNFDKMMPRFLEKKSYRMSNADYSPNYNAIFSGVLNNNPIDYEKRRKYYNLKKIITIYNPREEYLLFPELNIKSN